MTTPNETDKLAPSRTITGEHKPNRRTSGYCSLLYKCCFHYEKLIFRALTSAKSFRILPKFKPLLTLNSTDIIVKPFKVSCWIEDLK